MKRYHLATAAALAGLGLLCGCMSTNSCGERQGLFSRWFGGAHKPAECGCECVETGRVTTLGDGPVVPDPGSLPPGIGTPTFPATPTYPATPSFPATPIYPGSPGVVPPTFPTMPPPTAMPTPNPNPLAQPVPANPSSATKDASK